MHTRPVVVLALSAATGAGLMLARSHQRRTRNGSGVGTTAVSSPAAAPEVAESERPSVYAEPRPELFRIEARSVSLPSPDRRRNGPSPVPVSVASTLPPVVLPPERISSATLIAIAVALAVCAVALAAWAYVVREHQHASAPIRAVAASAVERRVDQPRAMSARSLPRSFAR